MGKQFVSETVFVKDIEKTRPVDVIVMNSHGVGQVCRVHRLPRRSETMEAWDWHVEEDGGKGATVSVALGRLGVSAGYIGKVGDDPWGKMGDDWMSEAGVFTKYMYYDTSVATGTGLIMVDDDGLNTIVDGDSIATYPDTEIYKVCTPGGITIKGLNEMTKEGFDHAVIAGLMKAAGK